MLHASKPTTLSLRIEPEIREAIETAADRDRRSMSNLIHCILADWAAGKLVLARPEAA